MVPVILDLNNINLKFLPHRSWETLLIWLIQFVRTKLGRFASYYRDLSVIQNGLFFSCSVLIYHLSLTPRLWHPIKCPNVISFFNSSKCRVNFVSRQRWELRRKRYFCILRHFAAAVQRTAPPAYFFFSFWGTKTKKNWKWRRGSSSSSSSSSNLQKKKNTGFCPEHKVKAIMKTLLCISVSAQLSRKERR